MFYDDIIFSCLSHILSIISWNNLLVFLLRCQKQLIFLAFFTVGFLRNCITFFAI